MKLTKREKIHLISLLLADLKVHNFASVNDRGKRANYISLLDKEGNEIGVTLIKSWE